MLEIQQQDRAEAYNSLAGSLGDGGQTLTATCSRCKRRLGSSYYQVLKIKTQESIPVQEVGRTAIGPIIISPGDSILRCPHNVQCDSLVVMINDHEGEIT